MECIRVALPEPVTVKVPRRSPPKPNCIGHLDSECCLTTQREHCAATCRLIDSLIHFANMERNSIYRQIVKCDYIFVPRCLRSAVNMCCVCVCVRHSVPCLCKMAVHFQPHLDLLKHRMRCENHYTVECLWSFNVAQHTHARGRCIAIKTLQNAPVPIIPIEIID